MNDGVDRAAAVDWAAVAATLDDQGWAILPGLLSTGQCDGVAGLYDEGGSFRSRVVMARHGFGRGEYKYFAYPLPALVEGLRTGLYERLAPIANRWHERMGMKVRFPAEHAAFLERSTRPARRGRRRCCSVTGRAITTVCIRISMASMSSRCRSPSCFRSRARRSRAASSC
jgi:hypothetical protein